MSSPAEITIRFPIVCPDCLHQECLESFEAWMEIQRLAEVIRRNNEIG